MNAEFARIVREMQAVPGASVIADHLRQLAQLAAAPDPVRARAFDDVATLLKYGRPYSPGTSVDYDG